MAVHRYTAAWVLLSESLAKSDRCSKVATIKVESY